MLDLLKNLHGKYSAYVVAGALVLIVALQYFGINIPDVPHLAPGVAFIAILGAFGLAGAQTPTDETK